MPFTDAGFPTAKESLISDITPFNSEIPWDAIEWIRADMIEELIDDDGELSIFADKIEPADIR